MCSKITIDKMKLNRIRIRERKKEWEKAGENSQATAIIEKKVLLLFFCVFKDQLLILRANLAINTAITEPSWKIVIFLIKYILDNELWVAKKDLLLHLSFIFPTISIGTYKPVFVCVFMVFERVSYCSQV